MSQQQNNANFIWSIADLLRGPYKPHLYLLVVGAPSADALSGTHHSDPCLRLRSRS